MRWGLFSLSAGLILLGAWAAPDNGDPLGVACRPRAADTELVFYEDFEARRRAKPAEVRFPLLIYQGRRFMLRVRAGDRDYWAPASQFEWSWFKSLRTVGGEKDRGTRGLIDMATREACGR
ncbi:hypothetical protein [Caulobacter mirabilis]|nr:hypothetical protein [Caulobacter mirabilis]